ncbi:MAG TPA: hypothetical protein PK971_14455, partial [Saprospiraceae bacterium]|nr:hypothetical protein [Saprospiraceae bacterium]HND89530.1 hypothetical protein [Saprospiraceae bacterium]
YNFFFFTVHSHSATTIAPEYTEAKYHKIRLSPKGFTDFSTQAVGHKPDYTLAIDGGGQNVFSPD